MGSMKDLTIFVFEVPWTDKFKEEDGFLPQASILPYIQAVSQNSGCGVIYRQIRTGKDLKTWSRAMENCKVGKRLVWFAGHGEKEGGEIQIRMPDYIKKSTGNRIKPTLLRDCLSLAGGIDGLIVDSCNFGKNPPDKWMPKQAKWGLAYRSSVDWTESIFFGIKTVEWLYERSNHPTSGSKAKDIFESGIKTGGYKLKKEKFSLVDFGASLKASFFHKIQGAPDWQELKVEGLKKT